MFTQPAALLFLVTEELVDREPLHRLFEFALVRRDQASESGGEFRAQGYCAFTFVNEVEKLRDDFPATFFLIQLGRFQDGTVPFDKSIATRDFPPFGKDVVPLRARLR